MNDKRRIMIVDDMAFMRNLLASILEMGGYTIVAEAADGMEAVGLYHKYRPYITLMDLNMPGMDGIETARRIRDADIEARIILCSVAGQKELNSRPYVDGVIFKPFNAEQVLKALQDVSEVVKPL